MLGDREAAATLAVSDLDRARAFYEGTLGLTPAMENPGAVLYRSGGSIVLVYPSAYAGTNKATAASWTVGDEFDAIVDDLRENCEGAEAVGMTAIWHRSPRETIARLSELTGIALAPA